MKIYLFSIIPFGYELSLQTVGKLFLPSMQSSRETAQPWLCLRATFTAAVPAQSLLQLIIKSCQSENFSNEWRKDMVGIAAIVAPDLFRNQFYQHEQRVYLECITQANQRHMKMQNSTSWIDVGRSSAGMRLVTDDFSSHFHFPALNGLHHLSTNTTAMLITSVCSPTEP